jgi:hypothetical protein
MSGLWADRVKDTSTTTGTGAFTLAGSAPSGFRTFASAFGATATVYYVIAGGAEWEVGVGAISTSTTLTRTTVLASSNAGAAVNFSAGTKDVFCSLPAGRVLDLAGDTMLGKLKLVAGTTSVAPLELTSGTNLTTPAAGSVEYDGVAMYLTPEASNRMLNTLDAVITLTSDHTLTSTTSLQAIFNAPANGAFNVPANRTYLFEGFVEITTMSASSGDFKFGMGGTATIGSIYYQAQAAKQAATANSDTLTSATVATASSLVAANTTTTGRFFVRGKVVVTTAGTLIPQIGLGVAAAAVIKKDSFFRFTLIGSNTVQSVGNWT